MPASELDLVAILRALDENDVEFVVVGALAASLQGAPLVTFDLDVVHRRTEANLARLERALTTLDARYRDPAGRQLVPEANALSGPGHHLLSTKSGPLDVLGAIEGGRGYDELAPRAVELEIAHDLRIKVLGLETLVELKSEGLREKDRAVLPLLKQTLAETKRKKD